MKFQKISFKNEQGESLSARLDLPIDGKPIAYALLAHCFTCSKNLNALVNISNALNMAGIAVFRFDFTGLGESEGDFADSNFSSNVADLVAAANYMEEQFQSPKILIGHSLGGAAVLQAASQIESVESIVTIAAPCSPTHVTHLLESSREEIQQKGEANLVLGGRKFTIKKQFLNNLDQHKMQEKIRKIRKALLIFHSPVDKIVGIENATWIFKAAMHPKSFISLDKADHMLTDPSDSLYVGSVIAAWARKYISIPKRADKPLDAEGNQVIVRTGKSGFRTEVKAGEHVLLADEPEKYGGTDTGPNPYDYLVTALGTCTSMTLRMYADRKKWPLDSITVRLSHSKIHASDCRDCESKEGKIDVIEREIDVDGELDDQQRQRLLEIADMCPVHRTLHGEVKVMSKLKT